MGCFEESFKEQVFVEFDVMAALGNDVLRHPTCSNDMDGAVERGQQAIQEAVDHGSSAVEDAALHALQRVTAYHVFRFFNNDGRQLRGALTEGTQRGLDTRDDQSAQETALGIDDAKGGGGAKVDNDGWRPITGDSA